MIRASLLWLFTLLQVMVGLMLLALGIACMNGAFLGVDPWAVLIQGWHHVLPLTLGQAAMFNGFFLILVNYWLARIRPNYCTFLTIVVVGSSLDFFLQWSVLAPLLSPETLWQRWSLLLAGVAVMSIGVGLYLEGNLGSGPVEGFMLAVKKRLGCSLRVGRIIIDSSAVLLGFFLGGQVGVGTLLAALGTGPLVQGTMQGTSHMKTKWRKARGMVGLFLLVFLVAFNLPGQAQRGIGLTEIRYLKDHQSGFSEGEMVDFRLLEPHLQDKTVFFLGEAHGVGINSSLDFALLTYLHGEAQVRYYLWEAGYALGQYMNVYLESGCREDLDFVFRKLEGTAWWTQDRYHMWQELYAFNQALPPEDRIEVVGLDVSQPFTVPILYLQSLVPTSSPPQALEESLTYLHELSMMIGDMESPDEYYSSRVKKEAEALGAMLKESLTEHDALWEEFLGEDREAFSLVVATIFQVFSIWQEGSLLEQNRRREQLSYENFLTLYPHLDRGAFYGQWGSGHILQRTWRQTDWLATHLQKPSSPVGGQVLSILPLYMDCERLDFPGYTLQPYTSQKVRDLYVLQSLTREPVTLFSLVEEGSPFSQTLYFLLYHGGGVTTDYFQFILYIQGAEGSEPLGEEMRRYQEEKGEGCSSHDSFFLQEL